uniref:DUF4771 domain-containing protein n=1 Tax=Musca domestica TaxID=7370 RepID=A0A1I8M737_MUSDO
MTTTGNTEIRKKDTAQHGEYLIEDFLHNKDVAPWFRGTSIFHLRGANQLFNAIRDDTEQRTTHRVKTCLSLIGLEPIPSSRDLKLIMGMSRGNDLAFLWFLMERHYRNPNPKFYNLNEQLICSAICHLDMITTLRELDRILPTGRTKNDDKNIRECGHYAGEDKSTCGKFANPQQCGQLPNKSQERNTSEYGQKKENSQSAHRSGRKYILPYFEKSTRPRPYGKPLTMDMPNFKVQFRTYAKYADPNHTACNESNRWFADYDFNPGRRVAYQVIQNAIANLFENFNAVGLKEETVNVLCGHHKIINEIREQHMHEHAVQLKDRCLQKYFGNRIQMVQNRRELVKLSLRKTIEAELSRMQKQSSTHGKQSWLAAITSACDMVDVNMAEECGKCCPKSKIDIGKPTGSAVKTQILEQTNLDRPHVDLFIHGKTPSQLSIFTSNYMKNYDFSRVGDTPKASQTFFCSPTEHKPFIFDYRKIFQSKTRTRNGDWVKQAFIEALNQDLCLLNDLREAASQLEIAASQCATNIWQRKLQKCNNELKRSENRLSSWPLPQYPPDGEYDVEDRALMDKMLADAFEYMRRDPKFVLAQLPEAHKLPMLREWLGRRFGKVYTTKDRYDSYRYSLKVFHALDRMSFDFPTPTSAQIGQHHFVTYNCKKYLGRKVNVIKRHFFRRLDNAIMRQSRTYWFAMRGYLCSGPGPPRQTFFAYMPSRLRDIQRFRLWKRSEHRPDKAAWDNRTKANRSAKSAV